MDTWLIAIVERKAAPYYIASLQSSSTAKSRKAGGEEKKKKSFQAFLCSVLFKRNNCLNAYIT